jgi:hypothetical protein
MLSEQIQIFEEFRSETWSAWRSILDDLTPSIREFIAICGRGSGKSRIAAALACVYAVLKTWPRKPGENIFVAVVAPTRSQASVTHGYIRGLLRSVPRFERLIETETADSITLSNGVVVEVVTASLISTRGRSYALVIVEEAAFLPADDASANPDTELIRALRPGLARVPGSLLVVISSPYARRGFLWQTYDREMKKPSTDVLVVRGSTVDLNPTFDERAVARAFEEDPVSAASEYGAEFRSDVERFVTLEVVTACTEFGVYERPPERSLSYVAFVDPSGGRADAFTFAVAHSSDDKIVLDLARSFAAPFSPASVIAEISHVLKAYRISEVVGDRYAGSFSSELFGKHGITYTSAPKPKSDLYIDFLARLNSRGVTLLDIEEIRSQLLNLDRKTARGGRDSIDHAPGGHDDLANAVAGVAEACGLTADTRGDWILW